MPRLFLWKDKYNKGLPDHNKINIQAKCQVKSIKSLIGSILDKNKKEIFCGNTKFKVLLVIYKEVIWLKNIRGYHSKVIIGTDFLTIGVVYIVVSDKTLYLFTS